MDRIRRCRRPAVKPEDVPDRLLLVDTDVFSYLYTGQRQYEAFRPLLQGHLLCMSFASGVTRDDDSSCPRIHD
jgi:hypothetical protein